MPQPRPANVTNWERVILTLSFLTAGVCTLVLGKGSEAVAASFTLFGFAGSNVTMIRQPPQTGLTPPGGTPAAIRRPSHHPFSETTRPGRRDPRSEDD